MLDVSPCFAALALLNGLGAFLKAPEQLNQNLGAGGSAGLSTVSHSQGALGSESPRWGPWSLCVRQVVAGTFHGGQV